jgi:hypothetical protein
MEIPEKLREIVDRLGVALVRALANDESSRALVQEVQAFGFDMALMLEATVALHRREDPETDPDGENGKRDEADAAPDGEGGKRSRDEGDPDAEAGSGTGARAGFTLNPTDGQWSEEDKAFLKTFKIALE